MLGEQIARLRKEAGLNQRELAEKLQVSASAIGMYEQNRRAPALEKLQQLAALFGVTVDHLMTGRPVDEEDFPLWRTQVHTALADARMTGADGDTRPISPQEMDIFLAALPEHDEMMMREALDLAAEAAAEGEVPVGCVITRAGKIVGRGRNRRERGKSALAHAEIEAIAAACRTLGGWRLWECTLYVTLEPCPMCAGAIINARIPRVLYGAHDKKAGSCGSLCNLFELPYNHQPTLETGLLEQECADILKNFFKNLRNSRKKSDPSK